MHPEAPAFVVVDPGTEAEQWIPIHGRLFIGREVGAAVEPSRQLVIGSDSVSRRHLEIRLHLDPDQAWPIEAATNATHHPAYAERYQRTRTRLGRQRGKRIARVDIARRLSEAIWHMLIKGQPFAPAGAASDLAA